MTREQVLNSIQLKKRFCKDCNLPIAVFDNPYFYERLCTLDTLYDCVDKFDQFCIELMAYPDEQSYFEYYNSVKDAMITHIKENPAFQKFNNQDFKSAVRPTEVSKRNLYVEPNDKGVFISIDMRKANFSALKHYSKDIFDGCETWEEYVGKFTDSKHIANSKCIRQVVLGACNPKRQIQYEHHLMSILCLHIQQTLNDDALDIYSLGEDEIIITVENPNEPPNFRPNFSLKDLQYYIDNYDNYVCYKVKKSTMEKSYETIADYFASLDIEWLKDYEILGVELEQRFTVDGYDFIGFIDLLLRDKRDGKIVVLDHKSSEYPFKKNGEIKKKSQQSFESYKRQMYLYCHAIHQTYKEFPKEITWNHFKDGGVFATIPFIQSEYEEAIKWFKDTIKTIELEEEFEPSEDFFYCTNLCNFRHSCEYRKAASRG